VLTNPVYAGAYVYGKTRQERYVDESGKVRKRLRRLPRSKWAIVIPDHHPGFTDWETFEANQARLSSNTRPRAHQSGGAVREGAALLPSALSSAQPSCPWEPTSSVSGRRRPPPTATARSCCAP